MAENEKLEQRTETKQTPIVANTGYINKQALLDEFEQWTLGVNVLENEVTENE